MELNIQLILEILSLLEVDINIIKEEEISSEFRALILAKETKMAGLLLTAKLLIIYFGEKRSSILKLLVPWKG